MLKINEKRCLTSFLLGRKCVHCGHRKFYRTRRGYRKCVYCGREKSLKRLRRVITVIAAFRRQQTALLTSLDTGIPYKAVKRVYDNLRLGILRECEREAGKMSGEIEMDEAYFGGRCKGKRGRGAARQIHRIRLTGAGWKGVYQGCRCGVKGNTHGGHTEEVTEGIGLLHRQVQELQFPETLRQALYAQSRQDVCAEGKEAVGTHQRH